MELSSVPLYDHHCHALRRPNAALDGAAFRRHFTESGDPEMVPHILFSLFYERGLRDLAEFLGCAPEEETFLGVRAHAQPEAYARRLFDAAHIATLLVDTGFRSSENYSIVELQDFLPCAVAEVLRIESLAEQMIASEPSFERMEEAFRAALMNLRNQGIVALKTIAAYRGGLELHPRSRDEARAAFAPLREIVRRYGRVRLSDRAILDYLLRIALEAAAAQELPVQIHTGFGDDDADLRTANPLHLRPLFQDESLKGTRFVLLHTYPFTREASYLASVYSHVYADLSLTIPFTAHGGVSAILAALELAPTSKILLATDASSIPELFYLGARYVRESLAKALTQLVQSGWLTHTQSERAAWQLLYGNAVTLYERGIDHDS